MNYKCTHVHIMHTHTHTRTFTALKNIQISSYLNARKLFEAKQTKLASL